MKLLVCGGRDYQDAEKVTDILNRINERKGISVIIEGGAHGADRLAQQWAGENGIHYATVRANWEFHGKAAGPKRNSAMLELLPDGVVAFPGGRGTQNMIYQARSLGIKVMEVAQ